VKTQLLLCAVSLFALAVCSSATMATEPAADAPYEIMFEWQESSVHLKVDWKGEGRDLDSGKYIEVPASDSRRMVFVSVDFIPKGPMLWRSNFERRLKSGELTRDDVRSEEAGNSGLVRATIVKGPDKTEFFFKPGAGPDLDRDHYVALCFPPVAFLKGAIHCSTSFDLDSYTVDFTFDRAFLWDFDKLQAQVVAAARHYVALPRTQSLIKKYQNSLLRLSPSGKPAGDR
jgi:hypothetical protein